ncbi:SgcJ/EcaC family oxidoreductase [Paeniglutamicibacter kerguelensis]|uniref:Uncharacterized protein (TIGR02246 family) n=1 Tax=Paeniglutamicibacter kerguelensis TaxID=254788 RepID=A0ABS4XBN8_9MICC|nr:SgcJ/EcaC family oxidoreductase [Paeniglutamicibacter kerguelensis]MBP2385879.1 uncharacterized protein (TIGR02246 family) [Paeniglutamicibacter kerguelensis]
MIESPAQVATGFAAAWNAADADALASLFAEDADFVNVVGLWWKTRSQIKHNHAYGFRRIFPRTVMTLDKVAVRELGPDVAVVHAAWSLSGQIGPSGDPVGDRSGVLSFTLSRSAEEHWLAVSAQNTDRVPGAQTYVAGDGSLTPATYARPS